MQPTFERWAKSLQKRASTEKKKSLASSKNCALYLVLGSLYLFLNYKAQVAKHKALLGGFVVDLVCDGAQNQGHFRIAHLRRFKANLDIEITIG